jgi:hypothetical protein
MPANFTKRPAISVPRFTDSARAISVLLKLSIAMPFPLAHPAAVLPLRRYCPRWLSFPALVIGSLTPDFSYILGEERGGILGHRFLGSFEFCLPAGIVLAVLFYALRTPVVRLLPEPYQRALLPLCRRPYGSIGAVLISLLIGAWTHLLWDSFTHNDGWFVQNLPVLQGVVLKVGHRTARICHVLWYGCSFAGVVWLFLEFEKWKQARVTRNAGGLGRTVLRDAVLVAILVVPIQLVHHLIKGQRPGLYLIAALCALPIIGIVLKMGNARRSAAGSAAAGEEREED